ncbi:lipopolysaccharide biosynthesis protein [Methylobacterium mesophilicum SR1.6/6]|uniref:Lipopolysaccharide biosynthesis protein n=1 Tax=Methylobacterium mesophilicum SR1.6/6 TaxID=908290 RepID=A0A6B9FSW4_9HYPH|nr:Wzz/FepE/Etk N-terminal domain-containing protein [Methylobacterium mesophilicum]QGY04188.1 lipopolysaccharide biosynthesis protein [Methylobacterium mesophilicum SR1.6/6]
MSVNTHNRIPPDRLQPIRPLPGVPSAELPDGPLAVLSAALKAAIRQKYVVLSWVVICVGLAAFYAITAKPTYTATATLLLDPRRPVGSANSDSSSANSLDTSRAESELQVLRSERLLANVFNSLDLANNPAFAFEAPDKRGPSGFSLRGMLGLSNAPPSPDTVLQIKFENFVQQFSVRRVGQSYVVEVSYTSGDPTLARRIANAAASAYLWQSIAAKADAAKNGAEFLQGRVNALNSQARSAATAVSNGSLPDAPTPDADARIIGAALQPLKPSAPRKPLILGLGATVGIVGGLLVVAIRQALDRRIRTPQDLAQRVGLSCLATLPSVPRPNARGRRDAFDLRRTSAQWLNDTKTVLGIRNLRTSIMMELSTRGLDEAGIVAFVSCGTRSASPLIGLSLVKIIRESGELAVLIDADIYGTKPEYLGLDSEVEDYDTLAGLLLEPEKVSSAKLLEFQGASILPARMPSREIGTGIYLGSPAFQKVVNRWRATSHVVLDLPSLSDSADTLAAARQADAVVIIVEATRTTADEVLEAVKTLRNAGAAVTGAVLHNV